MYIVGTIYTYYLLGVLKRLPLWYLYYAPFWYTWAYNYSSIVSEAVVHRQSDRARRARRPRRATNALKPKEEVSSEERPDLEIP